MTVGSRILIAANPKSGSSDRSSMVVKLSEQLGKLGFQTEICSDLKDIKLRSVAYWNNKELHCVVAAGGDGTVCAVAERLPPDVPIGIFPMGTENLLARYLELTCDPASAAIVIAARNLRVLDAGHANGRLFLVMASVGFDAEVVNQVHSGRRGHIWKWTYAIPILKTLATYRFPKLSIHATLAESPVANFPATSPRSSDSKTIEFDAHWLFVFNVARYAGGLDFRSEANPSDGFLNACSFRQKGIWRGLYYLTRIWSASLRSCSDYRVDQVVKMTINSTSETGFQIDGDFGGKLPLTIEIIPQRVTIIDRAAR